MHVPASHGNPGLFHTEHHLKRVPHLRRHDGIPHQFQEALIHARVFYFLCARVLGGPIEFWSICLRNRNAQVPFECEAEPSVPLVRGAYANVVRITRVPPTIVPKCMELANHDRKIRHLRQNM
ncbi:hypothetical protein ATCV1_z042L [Acanthocystis turfacea chlorella virus 1]|uniref:Uncharacterized protein z042L n=1 Tax=Chlorovirus heliozoae TaxID=322019 RepID=A7K802_9PHYC|nr:hypothetical protein ATCV1_z042L [Acanthocystis turfacea chlorella virus 1]ABT16176.1 hypothetical protein ATCV1_z042L [Acanthocystis turfacea chlorella virus 1]